LQGCDLRLLVILSRQWLRVSAARNTALLQLGAELPSLVLADLLGVHINTAERWNAAAGARWTNYVATRSSPR
jgi:hypothetical protein